MAWPAQSSRKESEVFHISPHISPTSRLYLAYTSATPPLTCAELEEGVGGVPHVELGSERAVVEVGYEGDEAQQMLLRLAWGYG